MDERRCGASERIFRMSLLGLIISSTFVALKRGGVTHMLQVQVKEGESIDRALKRYKRKFDRTGTMRQLRSRQQFTKPSVARRKEKIKASYIQSLRSNEEE